jgi:hypothetical protein
MPARMKTWMPALLLALFGCMPRPNSNGNDESVQRPIAQAGMPTRQDQVQSLTGQKVITNQAAGAAITGKPVEGTSNNPDGSKPSEFDPTTKYVFVDIYVTLGDLAGQRALAPYLLKPEEWMLVRCEMLSPTYRHYRFMHQAGDKTVPTVNIFGSTK